MVGPTVQIAALTCHLNAACRGIPVEPFFPSNSTCQFCEYVRFIRPRKRWLSRTPQWEVLADTPDAWIDQMCPPGPTRASLVRQSVDDPRISDRMSAAFIGGGGRWHLDLHTAGRVEHWEAQWAVGDQNAPDRRIWHVQYVMSAQRPPQTPATSDETVNSLSRHLAEVLPQIESFAHRHDMGVFADCFSKALACLVADDPFSLVYHRDLAPTGALDVSASRLLACCQAAWVFGGMGSWNDLGFEGAEQETYVDLSDRLFTLLNRAICTAVNSSAGPAL